MNVQTGTPPPGAYFTWLRVVVIILPALCAGACAPSTSTRGAGSGVGKERREATSISGAKEAPAARAGNPAVVALIRESDRYAATGRTESAAASLERALRLSPKDAALWHRLARVRQAQGRWQESIELARKSSSLAAGNRALLAANWMVIARSLAAMGDGVRAASARRRAAELLSNER